MKSVKISFDINKGADLDMVWDAVNGLLGAWRMNGQILTREYPIAKTGQGLEIYSNAPEANAFAKRKNNVYVNNSLGELKKLNVTVRTSVVGDEPESANVCGCREVDAYILFTNYLSVESPLRCAICFGVVPLYKIPKTAEDEYYDIICWQSDYQSCDSLQMHCQVGERFAINQLSSYDSQLTKLGLSACRKIEQVTVKPVYYYLYKYNGKNLKTEKARKCPGCGRKWLLKEPLHRMFDFRCDKCRLLSNIAWDIR